MYSIKVYQSQFLTTTTSFKLISEYSLSMNDVTITSPTYLRSPFCKTTRG